MGRVLVTVRELPCQLHDPDLWFATTPAELEVAKSLCTDCPARVTCLTGALRRREFAGVWGGSIFDGGTIISHKRPRGRPRKNSIAPQRAAADAAASTAATARSAAGHVSQDSGQACRCDLSFRGSRSLRSLGATERMDRRPAR